MAKNSVRIRLSRADGSQTTVELADLTDAGVEAVDKLLTYLSSDRTASTRSKRDSVDIRKGGV